MTGRFPRFISRLVRHAIVVSCKKACLQDKNFFLYFKKKFSYQEELSYAWDKKSKNLGKIFYPIWQDFFSYFKKKIFYQENYLMYGTKSQIILARFFTLFDKIFFLILWNILLRISCQDKWDKKICLILRNIFLKQDFLFLQCSLFAASLIGKMPLFWGENRKQTGQILPTFWSEQTRLIRNLLYGFLFFSLVMNSCIFV